MSDLKMQHHIINSLEKKYHEAKIMINEVKGNTWNDKLVHELDILYELISLIKSIKQEKFPNLVKYNILYNQALIHFNNIEYIYYH